MATILLAAVLLIASQSAMARGGKGEKGERGRGPDPEHRLQMLTLVLDLTEPQQDAIEPILVDEAEEIKAVHEKYREQGKDSREQAREEVREIHEAYSDLIVAELTEQQAEKYLKLEKLHRGKRGRGNRR